MRRRHGHSAVLPSRVWFRRNCWPVREPRQCGLPQQTTTLAGAPGPCAAARRECNCTGRTNRGARARCL
ncbi:hypothetical protein [Philosamia cynthia ricini nucleopolyhedrovirus virus]|nr:hypothetical protein [Philosamia cynthia ricini nucleopolyhedrovirus virus]